MRHWIVVVLLIVASVALAMSTPTGAARHPRTAATAPTWDDVTALLQSGVTDGVTPGAVALVANQNGIVYMKAVGSFTYGQPTPVTHNNPPMTMDSLFDMASCTKVLSTTTAAAQFYQRGELGLDWKVSDPRLLGPSYANNGKDSITVLNLLLHNAGYPPDPVPGYADASFGCPTSSQFHPPLAFTCQDKIFLSLLQQTLINPVGAVYVYSDLSMITMMYILGKLARDHNYVTPADFYPDCNQGGLGNYMCYYEAYVRKHLFAPLGMSSSGFLPPLSQWGQAPPAWNDTVYRHEVIQGYVSDENAYALGGIAGHAGLFSTAPDVYRAMFHWMYPATPFPAPPLPTDFTRLTADTISLFTKAYNLTQSSRALGWDTNDYVANTDHTCGTLSPRTFMHLGYTGTQVCGDPDRKVFTVLLTNRTYPVKTNTKIMNYRRAFTTMVVQVLGITEIDDDDEH